MLQFTFEGRETATRKDLVIAWSPVLLLDLCIGEYLLALVFWYSGDVGIFRGYGSSCPSNKATALVMRVYKREDAGLGVSDEAEAENCRDTRDRKSVV